MFTKIAIENFKCFQDEIEFPLSQINLLTGINGRGKSTLLQSLLLMCQSITSTVSSIEIVLNGDLVKLGSFLDVKNSQTIRDKKINLKFYMNSIYLNYILRENLKDNMILKIDKILYSLNKNSLQEWNCPVNDKSNMTEELKFLLPYDIAKNFSPSYSLFRYIHYVSADRIGPQYFYTKEHLSDFPNVGAKGQNTINLLSKKEDYIVNVALRRGENAQNLITQAEEWISYIFDGAKLEISKSEGFILELLLNTSLSRGRYKASNVGFGYSYILPIIVSGLIAEKDHILIVENPEAHLHPRAQSRLVEFLTRVSATGVQVFIETHSDYILNALRIAVLDDIVTSEQANILYFSPDIGKEVEQIEIKPDGKIEQWPEGFFDQMDLDFNRLFGGG